MKKLIIPLLAAAALLSGCHTMTVRHGVHQPPVVHHQVHVPATVQLVQHRHVHNREVLVHRHNGGQQPRHRHAQFNHYGPSRVVVVKPRHVIKPRVVTVRKGARIARGDHRQATQGHGRHSNGNPRREIHPRRDHRYEAKKRLNIWQVVRDAPHNRGDRDRSRHEHGNNDRRHDNGGHGHDGRGNNGKDNNGKADKAKARKVVRKNSDRREKQREGKSNRKER